MIIFHNAQMRNWLGVEHEPDGHLEGVPQPDPYLGLMITMVFLTTQMSPGMILQLSVAEGMGRPFKS